MLFALKKVVSALVAPLFVSILLLCAGIVLLAMRRSRRQARWGMFCVCAGMALLTLASCGPMVNWLSRPFESAYDAYRPAPGQPIDHVVVLGSSHRPSSAFPATAWLDAEAQSRLLEGMRVQRLHPGSRLLFTGMSGPNEISHPQAQVMAAQAVGVPADATLASDAPLRDTATEARYIARRLGDQPFVLVTSSWHMPRAMRWMRLAGAHALPAPAARSSASAPGAAPSQSALWQLNPKINPRSLEKSHRLLHESLGLLWLMLGGDHPPEGAGETKRGDPP